MMLITKEIEKSMPALYETESVPLKEKNIVCKFFNPCGRGTWYVAEGEKQDDGDWLFFGYVDLFGDHNNEWGYFTLNELKSIQLPFDLGIERDRHFTGKFGDVMWAA